MSLNRSTASGALKEFYLPAVREQLQSAIKFLRMIETNSDNVEGEEAVLSLHVRRNAGVGARKDGGALPPAGNQKYVKQRVPIRQNYAQIQISGPAMRSMKSDRGSFVRALNSETKGAMTDLRKDVNRQLFGTSDGVLVAVGAGSTTTVITFAATATDVQKRHIEVGSLVDIGTASPFTSVGVAREVTAVTATTFTVTPAFAVAPAAADSVVRHGSGGSGSDQKELTGIQDIVSDTGTLFGVDPSVEPVWKSTVLGNSGTLRQFTENLAAQGLHQVTIAGGDEVNLIVTSDGVHRAYSNNLTALKRFPKTLNLDGGYAALSITAGGGEVPLVWDVDAPNNTAFGLDTDRLMQHQRSDWDWMDEDGAILSRVSGFDAYEATLFKDHELTTDKRNAHVRFNDLLEA